MTLTKWWHKTLSELASLERGGYKKLRQAKVLPQLIRGPKGSHKLSILAQSQGELSEFAVDTRSFLSLERGGPKSSIVSLAELRYGRTMNPKVANGEEHLNFILCEARDPV